MFALAWVAAFAFWCQLGFSLGYRDLSQGAGNLLESASGSYSPTLLLHWRLPVGFDAESAALQVAREPDVWTDGSRVEDRLSAVSSSGAGFSSGHSSRFWAGRSWGHVDDDDQGNQAVASCRGYCSVPGPLQSVQRAELWGLFLPCWPLVVCI